MHLDALKFLVTIAQCGSTGKAADLLNTSSQNVSRVLKQLEDDMFALPRLSKIILISLFKQTRLPEVKPPVLKTLLSSC